MTDQAGNAPDWEGRTLLDRSGEKIGKIEELFLVEETGRAEWALVKLGRIKSTTTLVPLTGASLADDAVRTQVEKHVVEEAPRLDDDADPSQQQVDALYRHYRVDPDAGAAAVEHRTGNGSDGSPTTAHEHRADERAQERGNGSRGASAARRSGDQPAPAGSTLKRTAKEFSDDNLTHWAAALTYYGVLSIFPALLAAVAVLGLIGSSAIQPMIDNLGTVAPGPAQEILTSALQGLQNSGGGGLLLIVALAGAIWAASGYISGFMDASNAIYDIDEGRPIWKKLPLRIAITVLMLVLLSVSALAVVLTGPLAREVGNLFGVGESAVTVWDIAKWPVLVLLVSFMFAVLYYVSPNVKQPGLKSVLPGGAIAVFLWIAVSAAFAFYVANFGSYNETYGALGGVIVFMVWLWLTNLAILLGAEFNAERARGRHMAAGHPASEEPYLPVKSRS
ncbi:MAG TPA: YhjD/YihY/BrkB family envelope integrity protein [Solirubrobacteraceae bacterium]|nr:YhjD/YihY/BrkB family envelope integrity protein [Solirubrobacteraceae bacterium]